MHTKPFGIRSFAPTAFLAGAGLLLLCRSAVVQEPAPVKSPERLQAEALVVQGMQMRDASKKEETCYLEAYRIDPTYAEPLFDLGLIYHDRHRYEFGITYFERYLEFKKDNPMAVCEALYELAACYDNLNKHEEAMKYYRDYLEKVKSIPSGAQERRYIETAQAALRRTKSTSHSQRVAEMMKMHNNASQDEIVKILSRPRMRGARPEQPIYLNSEIRFTKNSSEVAMESAGVLRKIAAALKDSKIANQKIQISGHTSTEGDDAYNEDLSVRRAEAVLSFLEKECHLDRKRFHVRGFGKSIPIILPDNTEEERTYNRRVEFENIENP